MRHALVVVLAILSGCLGVAGSYAADSSGQQRAQEAGRDLIGTPAPLLVVRTIDGQTIDLGALYGRKAVYLKFWATWCVPCREQMPHFQHTYETAGPELAVIAVNAGFNDSVEEIRKYRQKLGITMPIVLDDGRLASAFHLRVTPQHIVIGRDGRIMYVGHLADAGLDAALGAAKAAESDDRSGAAPGANTPAAVTHLGLGDELPASSVRMLDGQAFALQQGPTARPTVLVFLSPWCESYLATTRPAVSANCRAARERVALLAGKANVRWLGISSGLWATPDDLREYQATYKISIPLALDDTGALFRQFGVANTPTILVASPEGRIVRRMEADGVNALASVIEGL